MNNFIELTDSTGILMMELCIPGTYYQGTRFDWSGVFRRITFNGITYADEWFDLKTEFSHDRVCGPSEEFSGSIGYEGTEPGGLFLKVGVGLLERENDDNYDSFHLYKIVDGGCWTVRNDTNHAEFIQELENFYRYEKIVEISGEDSFEIFHRLINLGDEILSTQNYCHNFFNIEKRRTGPECSIELDFHPEGNWRENAIHGYVSENSFRFDDIMPEGRNTYLGDVIPPAEKAGYKVTINAMDGKRKVKITCDRPASKWVFWANSKVATPEPYVKVQINPGETFQWTTSYKLV